jgi:hypothetical protein
VTVNPARRKWSGDRFESNLADNLRSLEVTPSRVFQITCSPDATEQEIGLAPDLPRPGDLFPGTDYLYAASFSAQRVSPTMWEVTVGYKGDAPPNVSVSSNPLDTPTVIDWGGVTIEAEIDEDVDGNPILTAAGEPVDGLRAIFCDQVVTLKKNMATYNSFTASLYRRSVNSDAFLGWPAGTAKLMDLTAKDVGGKYYEVMATVQFRVPYRTTPAKAWYARWRHEGIYRKVDFASVTMTVQATDDLGEPKSAKTLLDANGYKLADGATPIWKETKLYTPLPYSLLGFT